MKWNKQKHFSTYISGNFKINKYRGMWEVYHNNKYIGARYTLKEAKEIAADILKTNPTDEVSKSVIKLSTLLSGIED
jgi:hypothetical protein